MCFAGKSRAFLIHPTDKQEQGHGFQPAGGPQSEITQHQYTVQCVCMCVCVVFLRVAWCLTQKETHSHGVVLGTTTCFRCGEFHNRVPEVDAQPSLGVCKGVLFAPLGRSLYLNTLGMVGFLRVLPSLWPFFPLFTGR